MTQAEELARLGVATVHEAQGKTGLVDLPLVQVVPGWRVAGRARTALCGNGDNLMVHAAVAHAEPGDVLVLTMPDPSPVAVVGDLLARQALDQGVAAMLVDAAVRDLDELRELGLPIWARYVRAQGATKEHVGKLDARVVVGGTEIDPGDLVVLDADGAVVVKADRVDEVVGAGRAREGTRTTSGPATQRVSAPTTSTTSAGSSRGDSPGRCARPRRGGRDGRGRIAAEGCVVRGWDPTRIVERRRRARLDADRGGGRCSPRPEPRDRGARRRGSGERRVVPRGGQLYADLNTTSPALKRDVAAVVHPTGAGFTDVALLGTCPHSASGLRRSPRATVRSASPRSCSRSGCRSRWWATSRATRPG